MRKIVIISVLLGFVIAGGLVYSQGQPKQLTPEQQIEELSIIVEALHAKVLSEVTDSSNVRIDVVRLKREIKRLNARYALLLAQAQKLTAEKVELMGQLKAANAKIAQRVTIKPKLEVEAKNEKTSDNSAVDRSPNTN
jgi:chromosome segregation ATPase